MTLGLVCDACDALSPLSAMVCSGCGDPLGVPPPRSTWPESTPGPVLVPSLAGRKAPERPPPIPAHAQPGSPPSALTDTAPGEPPSDAEICGSCGGELNPGHRFCGYCGARVEPAHPAVEGVSTTQFFGAMQVPGRARLILIKGEGQEDGVAYHLAGREHLAGRLEGAIQFPEDPMLSPRHASFIYTDDGRLAVRDEGSINGVFIRIRGPAVITGGARFLVGEQLLRLEVDPPDGVPIPDDEGTYFYGSPKRPARLNLIHVLLGGAPCRVFRGRGDTVTLGREGNDLDFPDDPFISGRHALLTVLDPSRFELADLGSKNGTFLRVNGQAPLSNGDYVFLGQQLLRVEVT